MPLFLYDLSNSVLGAIFTIGWMAAGVGGQAIFQRVCRVTFSDGDKSLATAILAVIATVNSLLLAFTAIAVWEAYSDATQAVSGEASAISELSRDLATFGSPASLHARERLQDYARVVIDQEWPAMRQEKQSTAARDAFDRMFRAVGEVQPVTPREAALLPEIWARTNELVKLRRDRLGTIKDQVPDTLWTVVFLGTLLTLLPTYVLPRTRFSQSAIAMLALSMGLMFFFIVAMDRPFSGKESISPEPFESTLEDMVSWDAASGS